MARTIKIDPISRIEGHAHITLHVNDAGQVEDARFHLSQFRGFEKFCEGRPFPEMPALTARTCGICPVSHLVASSKACDQLLSVTIPPTGAKLRRLMNLAQLVQSHALSYFHLSSADLLLGMDADPKQRNLFGLLGAHPQTARDGIRLRQIGQSIIEMLGGKKIHPGWMVPGGVNEALTDDKRQRMLAMIPEGLEIAERTFTAFKRLLGKFADEVAHFGTFPTLFVSLVSPKGGMEHYDGLLRIKDASGLVVEDMVPPDEYARIIGEAVEPYSYMKFPYYRPAGYPSGIYRVGPLARLNNCNFCGTPRADAALDEFRALEGGRPVCSSFHFHFARLVEILYGLERIEQLLNDPDILATRVRARARGNCNEGIGVAEAPRGTLIHHYKIDDDGLITWANLIIATGHNNLALNRSVLQTAAHFVDGNRLREGMLNRVEAVVRCFDPCLSCASHALGQMPLRIQLLDARGRILDEQSRGTAAAER
ncbi:MAG: Ni/Fe hydrogenase subunit alpha [Pirellulaceae bacterium]